MPKKLRTIDEFNWRIAGIPCIVAVLYYHVGSPESSDGMLAGPKELPDADWVLFDTKGRRAEWLERKLTRDDKDEVLTEIIERMGYY